MDERELEGLKKLLDHFEGRKHRALKRLIEDEGGRLCFAIVGLSTDVTEYKFAELATLRVVEEPPGEVELARALKDKSLMSAIGRHAHSITHELAVDGALCPENQGAFNMAWWITSAIRVRTMAEFLIPAVSDHPWSTIAGAPQDICNVQLLEDVPRARRLGSPAKVSKTDLDWVAENLVSFATLLEDQRFRLAVECLTTHHQEASLRMTIASLWAGLEALFGVKSELRFRLSVVGASYLEPRGESRISLYRSLKKLYDFRSKTVHGEKLEDAAMVKHCLEVRVLLSRLLNRIVQDKRLPSEEDWDTVLLA